MKKRGIKVKIVKCSIPCDPRAQERMWAIAKGACHCRPETFKCLACKTEWTWRDFSGYSTPSSISCSNCYTSRAVITSLHVEMPVWSGKVRAYPSGRVRSVDEQVAAGAVLPRPKARKTRKGNS